MRINKFVALASGLSRRAADTAISEKRVTINGQVAVLGDSVDETNQAIIIRLDNTLLELPATPTTILLNKPVGYVCSRAGQGSQTIYDLLPPELQQLKPIGRLDKDSSGLLLLTNDGDLANELTHPRYGKTKIYEVELDRPLEPLHQQLINDRGIQLEDGPSQLNLEKLDASGRKWRVSMREGRNRQIRRTFAALNYRVVRLHRTVFGPYQLGDLPAGQHISIEPHTA